MTHEDILSRYPRLYRRCFDFSPPDGWLLLVANLSAKLDTFSDVEVLQIKSKFGELRAYVIGGPPEVLKLVNEYEGRSRHICETCGAIGELLSHRGWLYTSCPEHMRE